MSNVVKLKVFNTKKVVVKNITKAIIIINRPEPKIIDMKTINVYKCRNPYFIQECRSN